MEFPGCSTVQFLGCSGTPIGYKMASCELLLSCEMSHDPSRNSLNTHQWKRHQRCQILKMDFDWSLSRPSPKCQLGLGPNNAILGKPNKKMVQSLTSRFNIICPHTYTPYHVGDPFGRRDIFEGEIWAYSSSWLEKFKCLIITPGSILEFTVNSPFVGKIVKNILTFSRGKKTNP